MKKKTKKTKSLDTSKVLLALVMVTGVVYYAYRFVLRKQASINVVQSPDIVTRRQFNKYKLTVDPTPPPAPKDKGKPVQVLAGKEYAFNLLAVGASSLPKISAIEGTMVFDPSRIKITSFQSFLPVTLKKWSVKKINNTEARLTFAYGIKPGGGKESVGLSAGGSSTICAQETGYCRDNQGRCVAYNGCLKDKACQKVERTGASSSNRASKIGEIIPCKPTDEDEKTTTLLWVKYIVLRPGRTTISFPQSELKLAGLGEEGNMFDPVGSRLKMVVDVGVPIGFESPKQTQSPSPISLKGDLNGDGKVNLLDYNIFLRNYGKTGSNKADFNGDKRVDVFDYNLLLEYMTRISITEQPCWPEVMQEGGKYYWPNGCRGWREPGKACTQALVPLNSSEIRQYKEWMSRGKPTPASCKYRR